MSTSREVDGGNTTELTAVITRYHDGAVTWPELVAFIGAYPFKLPVVPDSSDYNAWELYDSFQPGTWGEVSGCEVDELLTIEEYGTLMEQHDARYGIPKD